MSPNVFGVFRNVFYMIPDFVFLCKFFLGAQADSVVLF